MKKKKICLENISKNYDNKEILKDINLYVCDGEIVSIIGPSGCGKSTIFNIISGITSDYTGRKMVDGEISYMYQKDLLLPYKKIIDNVSLPLRIRSLNKKEARENVREYFDVFGLKGYEDKYPKELSGGMRQRANFLRTYIESSDIMLLDEPFGALDSITKLSLQNWFLDVRKKVNSTILMITHDIDEAIRLSDRIYVLSNKPAKIVKEIDFSKDYCKEDILKNEMLKKDILKLLLN